jgi:hypothetical protein
MADTTELLPASACLTLAHTVGRLRPAIARELRLPITGFDSFSPTPTSFAPQPDGAR